MNIIIIEDEKPSARYLSRMLSGLGFEVNNMLHSVKESVQWFGQNEHPDLIFLDIQLSDGLSFEIFENIEVNSAIIFTTAYDEYALKAFKFNSIDYLLKPIVKEELQGAIQKYQERIDKQPVTIDANAIKQFFTKQNEPAYKKRFTIKVGQHLKMIPVEEIECFYSENKGTYICTIHQREYLLDLTLEQLESELDPHIFFRVSRKFYININAIKDMISYTNSRLQLKLKTFTGQDIIVSRERVKAFKNWLV